MKPHAVAALLLAGALRAAEPTPVIFQSGPGRVEVAAVDSAAAQRVVALADEMWRQLAVPLGLPEQFPTPVLVRLVPAAEWREPAAFRVIVEAGGVVSVRLRWDEKDSPPIAPRALVQALLMRIAVAQHGVTEKLAAPLWLEHACVGWWRTHADAAQLDALKQESARLAPPPLGELAAWRRGEAEPRTRVAGAVWLLAFLQSESTKAGEWPALLARLLGGDEPLAALAASFPGHFANDAERELWWATGWHHLRRVRTLPTLEAAESRAVLVGAARFVFARDDGSDFVAPLRDVLAHAGEPLVGAELARRGAELNRSVAALHPFYRNAGLSLVAAFDARGAAATKREAACAAFEQDWRDAAELEAATTAALGRWEKK